jgi:5'-nucleotidase
MNTILIVNDDGINSVGLLALSQALKGLGEIVIVTPECECSGIGKALSIGLVHVSSVEINGFKAYSISGTPADAYFIATNKILKRKPDIVAAGINLGPNIGLEDILNSGTIGAALEAAIHGVPAVAISYCIRDILRKNHVSIGELKVAMDVSRRIVKYVLGNGMPDDVQILSINIPEKLSDIRVRVTRIADVSYCDIHCEADNGYRIVPWLIDNYKDSEPGTDVYAVKCENVISITPIRLNLNGNCRGVELLIKDVFGI